MTNPLSRHSSLPPEDWDHPEPTTVDHHSTMVNATTSAAAPSRVVFPSQGGGDDNDASAPLEGGRSGKRTLSELLKLHAEKGTDVHCTTEEAARLEESLGRWVRIFVASPPLFFSCVGLVGLMPLYVDRSTLARRRTKGRTTFSHGRPMTRSYLCTARLPSIVSSDTHHMARARV